MKYRLFFIHKNSPGPLRSWFAIACMIILSNCGEDPRKEETPEMITQATLAFTPTDGGPAITVTATDGDGTGVQNIIADSVIKLEMNKTYILSLSLINGLADPADTAYDVDAEVEDEGADHLFFFSWTNNIFSDPAGDGNIDNRSDPVNYAGGSNSKDINNRPLGLTTTWTTAADEFTGGTFRVLLKHQPQLKSDISSSSTGETDLDVAFTINVK